MRQGAPRSDRKKRTLLALIPILVFIGSVWLPASVSAHAEPEGGDPDFGSRVATPPTELVIQFSEGVEEATVEVTDASGERVDLGRVEIATDRQEVVTVPVNTVTDGFYTVSWRVTSVDSHSTEGMYYFSVGEPIKRAGLLERGADDVGTLRGQAGDIDVTLQVTPVRIGHSVFDVSLTQGGNPVQADAVELLTYQSGAGVFLPVTRMEALDKAGSYTSMGAFTVPGDWALRVTVQQGNAYESVLFHLDVAN